MNRNNIHDGIPERRLTIWHNPTSHPQRVVLRDGDSPAFSVTIKPGDMVELDSRFDRAIHQVDCGQDDCHKKGWFCMQGHEGQIVGGLAPLLKRAGKNDLLDPTLDPDLAAKKDAEAQLAATTIAAQANDRAVVAAAAKVAEVSKNKK